MSVKRVAITLVAAAALALAEPARAETGVTDSEILIETCNALSGPNSFVGTEMNAGFKAYISTINAQGGIFGRKIKILSCDDRYEADGVDACFSKTLSDGAFGVTGCFGSALLAKYVPKAMAAKVPFVGFYSGPGFVGEPVKRYIFNTRTDFPHETMQMVEKLWKDAGYRKFAMIVQRDAYGYNIQEGANAQLKLLGGQICAAGYYVRNSSISRKRLTQ